MTGPTPSDPPAGADRAADQPRWRLVGTGPEVVVERDGGFTWRFRAAGPGRISGVLEGPRTRGSRVEARASAFLRAHPELAEVPGLQEALLDVADGSALGAAA